MEDGKKVVNVKDIGGTIYSYFLHFMLFSQIVLIVKNVWYTELLSLSIHILGMFYFMLRIHVFYKVRNEANAAGFTIVEYLREKYGV